MMELAIVRITLAFCRGATHRRWCGARPTNATILLAPRTRKTVAPSAATHCYPAAGHGSTCVMSTCRPMSVKSAVLSVTIVAPNSRADAAIKMS